MPDRAFRGSAVELAVYDLSPANDCLATIGWGLHHSGVRVGGREYTYSDDGVFSHSEGEVGDDNVRLRAVIPLGELSIDNRAVDGAVTELRAAFPAGSYHLVTRNCNHFATAFCERLGFGVPGWVNRVRASAPSTSISRALAVRLTSKVAGRLLGVVLALVAEQHGRERARRRNRPRAARVCARYFSLPLALGSMASFLGGQVQGIRRLWAVARCGSLARRRGAEPAGADGVGSAGQVIPTPLHVLDRISPISPRFFPFFAFSPFRPDGSNEPQARNPGPRKASTRASKP